MSGGTFDVTVGSDIDRDDFFAYLYYADERGEQNWGEVTADFATGKCTIDIFPPQIGDKYTFDLDHLIAILERAKRNLLGRTGD